MPAASIVLLTPPEHATRATRNAGRQRRSLLLDAASRLFRARGLAVSIADIAAAADAFPSQITYYFHTKEALFVEAACRDVLHLARSAEQLAAMETSLESYTRVLVESVVDAEEVGFLVEAMTLTRRRRDLAPLVERTVERLHAEGLRAYAGATAARGWPSKLDPGIAARHFWTLAIGVTLEGQAIGHAKDGLVTEMLRLLGALVDDALPAGPHLVRPTFVAQPPGPPAGVPKETSR